MATKKAATQPSSKTKIAINALAPKSLKDAALRTVKIFLFVFITAIPYQDISGADPSILVAAGQAGATAVVAYIANAVLNWTSDFDR